MRILLYTDVHLSETSSIVRKNGVRYSVRLQNIVDSVTWAEVLAEEKGCDQVVCLGDFFDKPVLNDKELTALQDIVWAKVPHYFLVGNHESSVSSLKYSSVNVLKSMGFNVVNWNIALPLSEDLQLVFIPYVIEEDRKPFKEYLLKENQPYDRRSIVFSHNDIKGIRYGKFISQNGFDLKEIEENCDLFINGHLHNGCFLNEKETILNLGNLTGQNFSEDAWNYQHLACILDTDTLELEFYKNPNAFNFYQIAIEEELDIKTIYALDNNAVVTFRCLDTLVDKLKEELTSTKSPVVEYRILTYTKDVLDNSEIKSESLAKLDYLKQFIDFTTERLENTRILKEELQEVCQEGGTM